MSKVTRKRPKLKKKREWKEIRFEPHEENEIVYVPKDRHKLDSRQLKAARERWAETKACMTCGRPFKNSKSHIDHCHVSGVIRGKLCYRCNVAIGLMRDDIYISRQILQHLEYFKYNPDMVEPNMWGSWFGYGNPKNTKGEIDEGF